MNEILKKIRLQPLKCIENWLFTFFSTYSNLIKS